MPLEGIDVRDPRNHQLSLPPSWLEHAINSPFQRTEIIKRANLLADVRARCKPFLINLSAELTRRFPVDDDLWKKTAALNLPKL